MLHSFSVERSEHDRTHMVCLSVKIPDEVLEDSPRHANLLDYVRDALADQVVRQMTDPFGTTRWGLDMGRSRNAPLDSPASTDPAPPPDPGRRALDLD